MSCTMHRDAVSTAMMVMLTERPVVCPHILYDITTPGGWFLYASMKPGKYFAFLWSIQLRRKLKRRQTAYYSLRRYVKILGCFLVVIKLQMCRDTNRKRPCIPPTFSLKEQKLFLNLRKDSVNNWPKSWL